MNSQQLLTHYERIADAPDAIARLRRFLVSLAISGKLVASNGHTWSESPIEECLETLADGKKIHQGWSPRCNDGPSPSENIWGVLRTTSIQDGYFLEIENKYLPESLPPKPHLEVQADDILVTCAGPRARCGVVCLVKKTRRKLIISGKMYRFRADASFVLPEYLCLFLRAEITQAKIDKLKTGSSESGLNLTQDRFRTINIRYGSLAEQLSIVEKVNELMGLCDQLEAARTVRETTRDRMAEASLARLNVPDPDVFQADAKFAVNALQKLTARADQIKQVRQTILNLAVRGMLGQGCYKDEPATVLLDRISEEMLSRKVLSQRLPDKRPHAIPDSWQWAKLGQLIVAGPQNGLSPKPTSREDAPKAITLTATTSGTFDPSHFKRVEAIIREDSEFWLRDGDLLFQRGNTREYVGMAAIYTGPALTYLFPDLMIRVRVSGHLNLRYVHLASVAPPARQFLSENAAGAQLTMPKINQTTLLALPIPLPPRPEQDRIVAKVDELMMLCDQLEASLNTAQIYRSQLLESLLQEALQPTVPLEGLYSNDKWRMRSAISSYLVSRLSFKRSFGRTAHMKHLYLTEAHLGLELDGAYAREAAGPLDARIYDLEKHAASSGWYSSRMEVLTSGQEKVTYSPGRDIEKIVEEGVSFLGSSRMELDRILSLMGDMSTEEVEIIATLFAVWNDALIDAGSPDDDWIVKEVREHWHKSKQRFTPAELKKWLGWMRANDLVPTGKLPRTIQQITLDF